MWGIQWYMGLCHGLWGRGRIKLFSLRYTARMRNEVALQISPDQCLLELNSAGAAALNETLTQSYWELSPGKYFWKNPFSDDMCFFRHGVTVVTSQSLSLANSIMFSNWLVFSRSSRLPYVSSFRVMPLILSVRKRSCLSLPWSCRFSPFSFPNISQRWASFSRICSPPNLFALSYMPSCSKNIRISFWAHTLVTNLCLATATVLHCEIAHLYGPQPCPHREQRRVMISVV